MQVPRCANINTCISNLVAMFLQVVDHISAANHLNASTLTSRSSLGPVRTVSPGAVAPRGGEDPRGIVRSMSNSTLLTTSSTFNETTNVYDFKLIKVLGKGRFGSNVNVLIYCST